MGTDVRLIHRVNAVISIVLFWGTLVFVGVNITLYPILALNMSDYNPILLEHRRCDATLLGNRMYFHWLQEYPQLLAIRQPASAPVPEVGTVLPIPVADLTGSLEGQMTFAPAVRRHPGFFRHDPVMPPYLDFHGFPLVPLLPRKELIRLLPTLPQEALDTLPTITIAGQPHTSFGMLHYLAEHTVILQHLRMKKFMALAVALLLMIIVTVSRYAIMSDEDIRRASLAGSAAFVVTVFLLAMVVVPNISRRIRPDGYGLIELERFLRMREDFRRYVELLERAGLRTQEDNRRTLDMVPDPPPGGGG